MATDQTEPIAPVPGPGADVVDVALAVHDTWQARARWREATMAASSLQRLCYLAQGWTLAWTGGIELFADEFVRGDGGPVCPRLHDALRGRDTVDRCDLVLASPELAELEPWRLRALGAAIAPYLRLSASELRAHVATTPQGTENAYLGLARGTTIGEDRILADFAARDRAHQP